MQEANLSFKTTVNKAKTLDEKNTQGKKKRKKGFQWILQLNNLCENTFNHNSASQVVLRNVSNNFKSQ